MPLRLVAVLMAAALTPITAVTLLQPAHAGVDTTPPEVGDCHDLTYEEFLARTDPDAPVECSTSHTSITLQVTEFTSPPDWRDWAAITRELWVPCNKALIRITGGSPSLVQMSAYGVTFFQPTKVERDAGAAWVRCDAVLHGSPDSLARVPRIMRFNGIRPGDHEQKCRRGKRSDFALTICTRRHEYVALWAPRMAGRAYPGVRAAKRFAARKCFDLVGDPAGGDPYVYEWVGSRLAWRAGYRSAVCLPIDY